MDVHALVAGLGELQAETVGDPEIRIAVLDGPVDMTHPCFAGARLDTLVAAPDTRHGATPWRFSAADYEAALSSPGIDIAELPRLDGAPSPHPGTSTST